MLHFNDAAWGWDGTFGPVQVPQVRCDEDFSITVIHGHDAQDMPAEPGRRTGCPAVAETVTQALVTPGAAVGVDIEHSFRHDFIDAGRPLPILEIEIFPKMLNVKLIPFL